MRLAWVLAVGILSHTVDADTCTNDQVAYIYQVYQAAAATSGCAKYAQTLADGTIKINWKCDSTECTPTMEAVASKIPYCTYTSGVNNRKELENALYTQCKLCTNDQQKSTQTLWQSAAATSSCSPYATSSDSSTSFSWPCSATGCTAVLKDLATKVPDCYTDGVNEQTRILSAVQTCTSVGPSPATPAPSKASSSTGDSSTCTDVQGEEASALWQAAAATTACKAYSTVTSSYVQISWPCSATSCTDVMAKLATDLPDCIYSGNTKSEKSSVQQEVMTCKTGGTNSDSDTKTTTPAPNLGGGYSTDTCSSSQVTETVDWFYDIATSSECAQYSTVTTNEIKITAPCTSVCVTRQIQPQSTNLDNCYYPLDGENKRQAVIQELMGCFRSGRHSRRLVVTPGYVTISYSSSSPIKRGNSPSLTPSTTSAAGLTTSHATWFTLALAIIVSVLVTV